MPWLKKAAEAPTTDKIWELSDPLYRLYDAALHYCARELTDGHVPTSRVSPLTPKPATKQQTEALVVRRLWHRLPGLTCKSCIKLREQHGAIELPRSGYLVHDYLEYNPSKTEWNARQERIEKLARLGGQARAQGPRADGKFASGTAGDSTSRDTSRAAGESWVPAPAVEPAVPLAKGAFSTSRGTSPVLRTPSSVSPARSATGGAGGDPDAREPEIPLAPMATGSIEPGARRGGLHHVGAAAGRVAHG